MTNQTEATEAEKQKAGTTASKLLLFLVTDESNRLRIAEMRRQRLKLALEKGLKPEDPRLDFINKASTEIFGWLGDKAQEYNDLYPHDTFTTGDIHDVLVNAVKKLRKQVELASETKSLPSGTTSGS